LITPSQQQKQMYSNTQRTAYLLGVVVTLVLTVSFASAQTTCTGEYMSIRTFDGTCNNLANVDAGSADSIMIRGREGFAYADTTAPFKTGVQADRPNLREVSNRILKAPTSPKDRKTCNRLSLFHSMFGQFLTHDMSLGPQVPLGLTPEEGIDIFTVPIEADDPFLFFPFPPFSPKAFASPRIRGGQSENEIINGVKQIKNDQTSFLDMSTLYWREEANMNKFRTFSGGQLILDDYTFTSTYNGANEDDLFSDPEIRTVKDSLPNFNETGTPIDFVIHIQDPPAEVFTSGDERTSENMALGSTHFLFYKEHNNCAKDLALLHPTWTDEQLFQKARIINTAQYQHIIIDEWLPLLVGDLQVQKYLGPYTGYDSNVDPTTSTLFANSAARYGHSTVINNFPLYDQCAAPDPTGGWGGFIIQSTQNGGTTSPLRILMGSGSNAEIIKSMIYTPMEDIDHLIISTMRNINIASPFLTGIDIPLLNMGRSRENGVPDFSAVYEAWNGLFSGAKSLYDACSSTSSSSGTDDIACFTSWMQDYDDIPDFATEVQDVYQKLIRLDTWFAFLAERKEIGSNIGRTLSRVIIDELRRKRAGDRFWYENLPNLPNLSWTGEPPLTTQELAAVKAKSMKDVLQRSFPDIESQPEPFVAPVDPQAFFASTCATVARFRLIDRDNTVTIKAALYNGNTINLDEFPTISKGIEVDITGAAASVKFEITGPGFTRTIVTGIPASIPLSALTPSSCHPFTLNNDVTIKATTYSQAGATGTAGKPFERTVTIVGSSTFAVTGFKIWNSATNLPVVDLCDGDTVSLSGLGLTEYSIEAVATGEESVVFYLNSAEERTENVAGYFIAGDSSGDVHPFSTTTPGTYTILAVPYDADSAGGNSGTPSEITFTLQA